MTKLDKTWKAVVIMVSVNLIVALIFVVGLFCKYYTNTPYIAGTRAIEYENLQKVMQDDVVYLSTDFFEENNLKIEDIYSGYEFNGVKNVTNTAKRLGQVKLNFDINKVSASQVFDKRIENIESYEYTLSNSTQQIRVQGLSGGDKKAKYEYLFGNFAYSKIIKEKATTYEVQINLSNLKPSRLRFIIIANNGDMIDQDAADLLVENALSSIVFYKAVS